MMLACGDLGQNGITEYTNRICASALCVSLSILALEALIPYKALEASPEGALSQQQHFDWSDPRSAVQEALCAHVSQ